MSKSDKYNRSLVGRIKELGTLLACEWGWTYGGGENWL